MKKYIYIIILGIFAVSCEKVRCVPAPQPLPYLPIICDCGGVEYDATKDIVLNSNGGELIFEVKEDSEPAYFSEYYFKYDDNKLFDRVMIQFHSYKGIDNYECDLFELKQIDEYRFNVRIFPSEQTVGIRFGFNPHNCNHYQSAELTVIVNGQ